MQSKEKEGLIFVRLFSDTDIFAGLQCLCEKHAVRTAVVVSGIGQLKEVELGYFKEKGDYSPSSFPGPLELISLSGNIVRDGGEYIFHLHAALGGEDKQMVGGHLIKGTVQVTNEIVILKTDMALKRVLEEDTGLKGLYLDLSLNI